MLESGIPDTTSEDTDPGLKKSGEIEAEPETGRRSLVGSAATQEKEEGGDIKMESAMGREIGEIRNGAGVGTTTGHGEVGARKLIPIS